MMHGLVFSCYTQVPLDDKFNKFIRPSAKWTLAMAIRELRSKGLEVGGRGGYRAGKGCKGVGVTCWSSPSTAQGDGGCQNRVGLS